METALKPTKTIPIHRWSGTAFMLGNVLFLVNKLDEMSRLFLSRPMADVISEQTPLVIFIGQLLLIFGYIGYFRFYGPKVGRAGRIALRLFSGGGILLAIGHAGFMSSLPPYIPASIYPFLENLRPS